MPIRIRDRLPQSARFACAACRYWFGVFPAVRGEMSRWRVRAQQIPDPLLRGLALHMQREKMGNVEGAAAYAAFAHARHRRTVVGAQVAFQTAYDYADMLSERGGGDPVANAHTLHRSLLMVAESAGPHVDYYAHCGALDDGGYLTALSDVCRYVFGSLPGRAVLARPLERAVSRILAYQGRNHWHPHGMHLALASWARLHTPDGSGLHWWETAASAGSSTGIFSFIAAASHPDIDREQSAALEAAYFPWAGSLHTLLDSLVDRGEDAEMGQRSLLDYYACADEAGWRMGLIADEASRRLRELRDGHDQLMIFAAMASLYVTSVRSDSSADRAISRAVLAAIGGPVVPAMLVFALRRAFLQAGRAKPPLIRARAAAGGERAPAAPRSSSGAPVSPNGRSPGGCDSCGS